MQSPQPRQPSGHSTSRTSDRPDQRGPRHGLPEDAPAPRPTRRPVGRRCDLAAVLLAGVLVAAAALVGRALERRRGDAPLLYVDWPPLYAEWLPHLGPGTVAAPVVAVLVVVYGPGLAERLPWPALTAASWAAAMAWTWSLALVDGWQRGVAGRLTARHEYLLGVDRFDPLGPALRDFTQHILLDSPDRWPAHIAGHPPGAVLTFVGLDRLGLSGGAWAGAWCITVGASAVAATLVLLRALTHERLARRAAPFLVLAPAAIWVGASADGYFAAVAAWALALLALAATRRVRAPAAVALASGLLFGLLSYLSYGLTLFALPALTVLLLARTLRPLPAVLAGVAAVAAVFTAAGFNWWEGYQLLVERYYQGVADIRPYGYWVWGNLATTALVIGPAVAAGLARALRLAPGALPRLRPNVAAMRTSPWMWRRTPPAPDQPSPPTTADEPAGAEGTPLAPPASRAGTAARERFVLLVLVVFATLLVADLSGMSKAETERIWLPFTSLLLAAAALLPRVDVRRWLVAQAALALLLNHLLLTGW